MIADLAEDFRRVKIPESRNLLLAERLRSVREARWLDSIDDHLSD